MRLHTGAALLCAASVLAACQDSGSVALDTENQKASYAIGRDMGRNLQPAGERLDLDAFVQGVRDALAEIDPPVPDEELVAAVQSFSAAIQEEQRLEREAAAERNTREGEAYLAENGAREGVYTTDSGLQYEVVTAGDGAMPSAEDVVSIHYRGMLIDGTEFDSSYQRGEPASFSVGGVIPGFSEALQLMSVGSTYRVVIPGSLGYGAQGAGGEIGPNATLIFEIELLGIQ